MTVVIEDPTLMDRLLEIGLFVGAIFQLICIFAVIILPTSNDEQIWDKNSTVTDGSSSAKVGSHEHSTKSVRKRNKKNR